MAGSIRETLYEFRGNADSLVDALKEVRREIERTPRNRTVRLSAQTTAAHAELDKFEGKLKELEDEPHAVSVGLNIRQMLADTAKVRAVLASIPDRKKISITQTGKFGAALGGAEGTIQGVVGGLRQLEDVTEEGTAKAFDFTGAWSRASQSIRRVAPLVAGLSIIITTALIPGILAMVSAITGAIVAVGALAAAFVAALGPAVGFLIAIFARVAAVIQALQARKQALSAESKKSADATRQEAQADAQLRQSKNAVRDATQQQAEAEHNLAEARAQARQAIADAQGDEQDAIRATAAAQDNLKQATVDAYREIRDSILDARDAQLDFEDAQLGVEDAHLSLLEAKQALKEFGDQAGISGKAFDSMFKKFTDIDATDTGGLKSMLRGAGASEQSTSGDGMLQLQRLILNVQKARLGEKQADERVIESRNKLSDATGRANRLQREGLQGVEGYVSAVDGLRDATERQADATRKLADLERAGVEGSEQVHDAKNALRDANENLRESELRRKETIAQVKDQEAQATAQTEEYRKQREKLSGAEQGLLDLLIQISDTYANVMRPATDRVIGATTRFLNKLTTAVPGLVPLITKLGDAWEEQIDRFSQQLIPDDAVDRAAQNLKFDRIFQGTINLSSSLGDAFRNAFQVFINVAAAAMPYLESFMQGLADALGGFAKSTDDTDKLTGKLKPFMEVLDSFIGIVVGIGRVLVNSFTGASGPINDFIKWISDGINKFADFLGSAEGKNKLKEFFEDTLPFVKSVIKFLISVGKVVLDLFEIFAPIFKPVIDGFTFLLDMFHLLLRAVNWLLNPFKGIIGFFLSFYLGGVGVAKILGAIVGRFGTIGGAIEKIGPALGRFGKTLIKPFEDIFNFVVDLFGKDRGPVIAAIRDFLGSIGGFFRGAGRFITAPFRAAWRFVTSVFRSGRNETSEIMSGLVNRFRSVLGRIQRFVQPFVDAVKSIWSGVRKAFSGIGNFFKDMFDRVVRGWRNILNWLVDGVNFLIKALNKVHFKVPDWVPGIGGREIGIKVPVIPHLAAGGIVSGATAFVAGEAGREAVLPLKRSVLAGLGREIVQAMTPDVLNPAMAGVGGAVIHNHINISAPESGMPDPSYTAARLAEELRRRGGR